MSEKKITLKKSGAGGVNKFPAKVLYNLDSLLSPRNGDIKKNIYMGPSAGNRIARERTKISPSGSATSKYECNLLPRLRASPNLIH